MASTTKVTNLNADLLDGLDSTAFAAASGSGNYIQNGTTPQTANFNITGGGTAGSVTITGSTATALNLSSTTVGTGLTIGGDTNLYRSAANTLKTDGGFHAQYGFFNGAFDETTTLVGVTAGRPAGALQISASFEQLYRC